MPYPINEIDDLFEIGFLLFCLRGAAAAWIKMNRGSADVFVRQMWDNSMTGIIV